MYTTEMCEQLLRCSQDARHFKTYLTGYRDLHAELLWELMFKQNINMLVVSKKQTESQAFVAEITRLYEQLPDWLRSNVTHFNKTSRQFDNGSRILTGLVGPSVGRGLSLAFLVLHRFDSWSMKDQILVQEQCLPCLYGSGGRLIKD